MQGEYSVILVVFFHLNQLLISVTIEGWIYFVFPGLLLHVRCHGTEIQNCKLILYICYLFRAGNVKIMFNDLGQFVINKAKGRISKRMLQENKGR